MNRIELEDNGFPFSADTVRFMQSAQSEGLKNLCKAIGDNFIAWGCEVSGTTISAGAIVVDGEMIPFEAGTYNAKFKIEETSSSVIYQDQVQRSAYFTRKAVCSANGSYTLANFPRISKAKVYTESGWTTVPFDNTGTWADSSAAMDGTTIAETAMDDNVLKANRLPSGQVVLIGGGKYRSDLASDPAEYPYAQLPEGFRPSSLRYVPVTGYGRYNGLTYTLVGYAWIYPNGLINLPADFCGSGNVTYSPLFNCVFDLDD